MRIHLLILFILGCSSLTRGQSYTSIDTIVEDLYLYNFDKANNQIETLPDVSLKKILITFSEAIKKNEDNYELIHLKKNTSQTQTLVSSTQLFIDITNAIQLAKNSHDKVDAFSELHDVLLKSQLEENKFLRKIILTEILNLYLREKTPNSDKYLEYLDELKKLELTSEDKTIALYYEAMYESLSIYSDGKFDTVSKKLEEAYKKSNLSDAWQSSVIDLLTAYYRSTNQFEKLELSAQKLLDFPDNPFTKRNKFNALLELAGLQARRKNKLKATELLEKSREFITDKDSLTYLYSYYRFGAMNVLTPLGEYKKAYKYLEKSNYYEATLNFKQNKEQINKAKIKLDTAETEKKLLISNSVRNRNQNVAIALGSLLILGSIIAFLINRNTKRKQRIAEQQREIEIQKTEKILKEQEITSINAMIEGQEKERQRVASDLHDSVGATLAAAKLQFDHISKNKDKALEMDELFEKTKILLDDAYSEVRSMAHIKNSGVIAKNGLLPAIKKLTDNVSINGNLEVALQDFGLENRLDNSLEITIFRIIQELITNIVKHANATEASINITQHESLLSIIVEDNGKGFNISEFINCTNGMGLSSIERRVEHLEGTMEVDSFPGKGTSVLIDIPL